MERLPRSSPVEPPVESARDNRGSVFDRESLRVLTFGDGETRLGLEGDLIGVFSSPRMTVTMEGRRRLRFLGVSVLESDLRARLYSPMSTSSAIYV